MPKTRQQKEESLKKVIDRLKESKSAIISDCAGLKVQDSQKLKKECKAEKVDIFSVKKSLLKKALADAGYADVDKIDLSGSMLVAFGLEDEVAPARLIKNFAKTHEQVKFRSGIVEKKIVSLEQVIMLSNLPSKLELYAKLVGSINAPVSGFVNVLAGNLRGLVNVLGAIKDKKPA